jgi:hypothetical protein
MGATVRQTGESDVEAGTGEGGEDLKVDDSALLQQRWAASPENIRSRSFLFGWILGFILVYGGAALLFIKSESQTLGAGRIVLAGLVILAGLAIAGWSFIRRNAARAAFYERQQQVASAKVEHALDQLEDETDLAGLLRFNRSQMKGYESLTREQASSSYLLSHVALGIGLALVIGGGIATLAASGTPTKAAAAGLAAIAVAVSGFLARTYLRIYERTLTQLNYYFRQPLISSYVLTAERLADKMSADRKDDVLEQIVVEVLRSIGGTDNPSSKQAATGGTAGSEDEGAG